MSFVNTVYGIFAAASVDADAANPSFRVQRGFSGLARIGVGNYRLTLTNAIAPTGEAVAVGTPNSSSVGIVTATFASETILEVHCSNSAGAAADIDFWVKVNKIAP